MLAALRRFQLSLIGLLSKLTARLCDVCYRGGTPIRNRLLRSLAFLHGPLLGDPAQLVRQVGHRNAESR
jgi:hypothetical protein